VHITSNICSFTPILHVCFIIPATTHSICKNSCGIILWLNRSLIIIIEVVLSKFLSARISFHCFTILLFYCWNLIIAPSQSSFNHERFVIPHLKKNDLNTVSPCHFSQVIWLVHYHGQLVNSMYQVADESQKFHHSLKNESSIPNSR